MKTDRYTKVVLTLIAVGLFANAGVTLISEAKAQDAVHVFVVGSNPLPVNCIAGCE